MSRLLIKGSKKLKGEVLIQGAKNSVLPILAATILCSGQCVLHNCPDILDVNFSIEILKYLGANVKRFKNDIIINTQNINKFNIPDFLMKEMRSSIIFLGSMLGKLRKSEMFFPGGCELGPRPIDLHLKYLKSLGILVEEFDGNIKCYVENKITGAKIDFPFPSVGATENIMLASVLAEGTTIINNAAREPEIIDLANFLNMCGAKIYGAGDSTVIIDGVKFLNGAEYTVMPDRIAAVTFMSAAAITGGDVLFENVNYKHLYDVINIFKEFGCEVCFNDKEIYLKAPSSLNSIKNIITKPYPGFPTDAQAIIMALSTVTNGTTTFEERVFPQRYKHVEELAKMGADIKVNGNFAIVNGVKKLSGANVCGNDLRGTAALVVAALGAQGESLIEGLRHLDRGYESIEVILRGLGAKVKRLQC